MKHHLTHSVTVIIPTFNSEKFLPATLESVLNQTRPVDCIVVVDDGSTDGTKDVIRSYLSHIVYYRQDNNGVANARNVGLELCDTDWVMFLDSDDLLARDAIRELLEGITDQVSVVYGNRTNIDVYGTPLGSAQSRACEGKPPSAALSNFAGAAFPPGCAIVRHELAKRIKFRQCTAPCEDRDFWIRCGLEAQFKRVDSNVLFYRDRPGSHSKNRSKQVLASILVRLDAAELIRKNFSVFYDSEMEPSHIIDQTLWDIYWRREWDIVANILNFADEQCLLTDNCRLIRHRLRYWKWLILLKDSWDSLLVSR